MGDGAVRGLSGRARLAIVIGALVVLSPIVVVVIAVGAIRADAAAERRPALPAQLAQREGGLLAPSVAAPSVDHPGAAAYAVCAACHGGEAEGLVTLGGPALAGQERWYLERQLANFKAGIRGSHPDDLLGQQMAPMAQTLADEAAISAVADYLASLPPIAEPETGDGDPARGRSLYATCIACHGMQAEGMEGQGGPALVHQHAWYLERQLANFKAGIRGSHPQDAYGQLMRPMAMVLPDEQAIADVVAYIHSLRE